MTTLLESLGALPFVSGTGTYEPRTVTETPPTFLVRCETFRCLAYQDQGGQWRNAYDHSELRSFKEVICHLD